MGKQKVVIVGGGFGGLEVAKALSSADVDVLLVDRANYHLFQPLLYQVAIAGLSPAEIASPIRGVFSEQKNVRVVLGEVTSVDLGAKELAIAYSADQSEVVAYDWLVLAVGAQSSYFGREADWERFAPGLKSIEDALEIRRRVLLAFERAERTSDKREREKLLTFAVIGGGPTGVELCGAIAELARHVLASDFRAADPREAKVTLVEAGPRILPSFPEDLAQRAVEQLSELGVEVRTGARVVGIDDRGVELDSEEGADDVPGLGTGKERERIVASTVVWGAGVRANPLGAALGTELDRQGRVVVGRDCALPGHPEVFAIGDMAHFEEKGAVLPGVSPVAMQQGRYVARLIRSELHAPNPNREAFAYFDKGSMATIGRSRAIAWVGRFRMHGLLAWLAWLVVHLVYLIGFRNRFVVVFQWFWSYLSYKRGARLITATGWAPHLALAPAVRGAPKPDASAERRGRKIDRHVEGLVP